MEETRIRWTLPVHSRQSPSPEARTTPALSLVASRGQTHAAGVDKIEKGWNAKQALSKHVLGGPKDRLGVGGDRERRRPKHACLGDGRRRREHAFIDIEASRAPCTSTDHLLSAYSSFTECSQTDDSSLTVYSQRVMQLPLSATDHIEMRHAAGHRRPFF